MHSEYAERWEVSLGDVQGRMSCIHFWPSTLTCACIKVQFLREKIVEHQALTPFLPISQYELKCDFHFSMYIPKDCTQIRLALVSGDINPISGKPKLICRSKLSLSEVRHRCPLHKYFSLYRWDSVSESNVLGGYIRIAFRCSHSSNCFDEDVLESMSRSSIDRSSLCSFERSETFLLSQSCDSNTHSLTQRPVSAGSHVSFNSNSQPSRSSSVVYSEVERSDSEGTKTERTTYNAITRKEITTSVENCEPTSSLHNQSHQAAESRLNERQENKRHYRMDDIKETSSKSKLSENTNSKTKQQPRRDRQHKLAWFSVIVGTTLGFIGTVATIAFRFLSKRKS
eukprot:g1013.t1